MKFGVNRAPADDQFGLKSPPVGIVFICALSVVIGAVVGLAAFFGSWGVDSFSNVTYVWGIVGYVLCLLVPFIGVATYQTLHNKNCKEHADNYDSYRSTRLFAKVKQVAFIGLIFALVAIWPFADHIAQGHGG